MNDKDESSLNTKFSKETLDSQTSGMELVAIGAPMAPMVSHKHMPQALAETLDSLLQGDQTKKRMERDIEEEEKVEMERRIQRRKQQMFERAENYRKEQETAMVAMVQEQLSASLRDESDICLQHLAALGKIEELSTEIGVLKSKAATLDREAAKQRGLIATWTEIGHRLDRKSGVEGFDEAMKMLTELSKISEDCRTAVLNGERTDMPLWQEWQGTNLQGCRIKQETHSNDEWTSPAIEPAQIGTDINAKTDLVASKLDIVRNLTPQNSLRTPPEREPDALYRALSEKPALANRNAVRSSSPRNSLPIRPERKLGAVDSPLNQNPAPGKLEFVRSTSSQIHMRTPPKKKPEALNRSLSQTRPPVKNKLMKAHYHSQTAGQRREMCLRGEHINHQADRCSHTRDSKHAASRKRFD